MLTLLRGEIRDSWTAWLGVSLGFVVTSAALTLSALALRAAQRASGTVIPAMEAGTYQIIGTANLVFCLIVGLVVIGSSTQLVIASRRGAIARLALAGASPGTVIQTLLAQLGVVALVSALIGDVIAILTLRPALALLVMERADDAAGVPIPATLDGAAILLANLAWLVVALIGGLRQSRKATRIPPVEALRQAQGSDADVRSRAHWLQGTLALVVLIGCFVALPSLTAQGAESFSNLMQTNLLVLLVAGWFLGSAAPALVRPVTAAWTRLGPSTSPVWTVARATVLARSTRLSRSVTPVMFAMGLSLGFLGLAATYNATLTASGFGFNLSHVGALTFVVNLGLALIVALAGSVGSLIMMSRQREAELALLGICGATPRQRIATAAGEALIITVTATLLGVVMVAIAYLHFAVGIGRIGLVFAAAVPLLPVLATLAVATLVTVAATVVPTLGTLGLPEPRVVARLVAQ